MTQASPREQGYRMPAEWEPQAAVWLSWPHNPETWPGAALAEVRRSYAEWIRALQDDQRIELLVSEAAQPEARTALAASGVDLTRVRLWPIETRDAWIRDYGPTFVVDRARRRLALVKWIFNAWGGKYEDLIADDATPQRLNRELELPFFEAGIVLEGGSIEVNGRGSLLTTEQCLLHPNRNPGLDRRDLERILGDHLGVSNVLWLGAGIVGDDTDGHVDDVARFVDVRTVVCAFEEDPLDANHRPLRDNHERLTRFRDEEGRQLEVVKLPMPGPVVGSDGRLPASYANFYIGNGCVVVPVFGHANDVFALDVLRKCFPRRRVVGVECSAMVGGLGTLHCGSQQQPLP